jgi:RHS repeat-associated protein
VVASSTQTDVQWDALADRCSTAIGGTTTTNVSTRYTYDGAGNLATMVDANGNTTTYGYDASGRQTAVTDALGRTVTTGYDALGRRTSQTDRVGTLVTWTYDAASRVATRTAGGVTTTSTYDDNGNRLTATASGVTITTQYDRLARPVNVTVSNDTPATTTYAYSLTSPSWTDPTGTYAVTLDKFDRQVALDDPVTTGTWSWSYRADGQQASVTPPSGYGSATSSTYDAAGRLTGLATANASFTSTYNRAGNRLSETATVTGDPQNGTATFTFDPLGRLASYALPGIRTLGATWQADPNRATLATDGTPVSTTFDAADRPTSTGFANDLDGRLTAIPARGGAPAKSLAYDALGRLTSAIVAGVTRTYAYDPLDRLVTISENGTPVTRLRYVGLTASVAQLLDGAWAVTRNIGTDWTGTPLADWAAGGSGWRRLITNGHGDLVATLAANGSVAASLRLDPWGVPLRAVPAGYPSFGFQGSLTDRTTTLVYARARWYDPVLATFTSEDSLAGDAADPPSRHLYAYGAGDPVDRVDPDGLFWYRVRSGDTLASIARRYYGTTARWPTLYNANRNLLWKPTVLLIGDCIWVRRLEYSRSWPTNQCRGVGPVTGNLPNEDTADAVRTLRVDWYNLTTARLLSITDREVGRARSPGPIETAIYARLSWEYDLAASAVILAGGGYSPRKFANMQLVVGNSLLPRGDFDAITVGHNVFIDRSRLNDRPLLAHEYIHTLQVEAGGLFTGGTYLIRQLVFQEGQRAKNRNEAIGYLWEGWLLAFARYGEKAPWHYYRPLFGPTPQ